MNSYIVLKIIKAWSNRRIFHSMENDKNIPPNPAGNPIKELTKEKLLKE